jgi:hypothetical protein
MPPRNDDLHGNAPDDSRVALVLVDVINDLEFEGGDRLLPQALAMADRLAALAARARRARVPSSTSTTTSGAGAPTSARCWTAACAGPCAAGPWRVGCDHGPRITSC